MGGNRADAGQEGGNRPSVSEADDNNAAPRDNGGASTPQWLFDRCNLLAIEACGEPISLDVAAAEWNHKCERYFTEETDALTQEWDANAVFCNPPFSATIIESFVRKALVAAQHGTTSVFLIPWWNYPYLDLCERHGRIHRICSPVCFQRQDGSTLTMNNQYRTTPLVIVVFGPTVTTGCGTPIRKGDTPDPLPADDIDDEETYAETTTGITARAIAGDGDQRWKNDAYYTPQSAIDALLAVEEFSGLTWEPAEGDGRIVVAMRAAGCEVTGSDVATGTDFLATARPVDNIVTNPPWGLKTEFIRHAKECVRQKVALLLPLSALSGVARRPLFEDAAFPLRALYVFDRRLNFDPDTQGSTTLTTGWFVWERGYRSEPVLRWISES
jgi:phage N-6-adenine-methyltransferase